MKFTLISTPNCAECKAAEQMLTMRGHEVEVVKVGDAVEGQVIDLAFIMDTFKQRQVPQFLAEDGSAILGGYDGVLKYIAENK